MGGKFCPPPTPLYYNLSGSLLPLPQHFFFNVSRLRTPIPYASVFLRPMPLLQFHISPAHPYTFNGMALCANAIINAKACSGCSHRHFSALGNEHQRNKCLYVSGIEFWYIEKIPNFSHRYSVFSAVFSVFRSFSHRCSGFSIVYRTSILGFPCTVRPP